MITKLQFRNPGWVLALCMLFYANASFATTWYVTKAGSDSSNGTSLATAFRTIQRASNSALPGDVVYVGAGIYREMVDLKADGVTYQPYGAESVTINGTDLITQWTLVSGSTYSATMNWDVDPWWGSNQLFCDGDMIDLARWPDQTSNDIIMPTNAKAESVTASGWDFIIYDEQFNEPDNRWVGAQIWVNLSTNGHDGQGWTGTVKATSQSAKTVTVTFVEPPRLGDVPWGLDVNTEYFLFNPTLAGISATGGYDAVIGNGEWWKNGSTVYVKTVTGAAPSSNAAGTGSNVIEAKRRHFAFWGSTNRSGYMIKDFNLFGCSIMTDVQSKNNRSIAEDAHDIILDGLTVTYGSHQTDMTGDWQDQHFTWSGVSLTGRNNIIRNCTIQYSATSAISIQGAGNKVLNNVIRDANYMCSNAGALNTGFINEDAEIAYNTIYNTTVMAINFFYSTNSNVNVRDVFRIHHNEIYNFMRRGGDSGAIDVAGRDLQWARIDHNTVYNTLADAKDGPMKHGIYIDWGGGPQDNIARVTIDHNVIYEVTSPILINNVRYVNVYNNVALSHGNGPNTDNAVVNFNGGTGEDCKIYNNILSGPPNLTCCYGSTLADADIQNNITNAEGAVLDELFVDAAGRDYRLKNNAAAAIDMGISVGVYDDNVVGLPDIGAFENPDGIPGGGGGNIAPDGLAYRWSQNSFATANANKVAAPGLNDEDLTTDVNLNGGVDDNSNAYEAAGVIWTIAPTTVTSVEFIQGGIDVDQNSCFTANLSLQFTADGTTWTESGWTVSPSYPYTNSAAGITYTFSGPAVSGKIGARISGQVHTNNNSWRANIREVLVYGTGLTSPVTTRYEAEDGTLGGAANVANNHTGYSGSGFVQGFTNNNAAVTFTVDVSTAGPYDVTIRYANAMGNTRSLRMNVNGTYVRSTSFTTLANWSTWADKVESLNLNAGTNTITLRYGAGSNGNVNIDYISITDNGGQSASMLAFGEPTSGSEDVFAIYPNPASTSVEIISPNAPGQIVVRTMSGEIVKTISFTEKRTTVDVKDLTDKVYVISVCTEGCDSQRMFIEKASGK